jgi:serine/threonine protein kinase
MGVMGYEMVTGSKPYPGKSLAEIMELHCGRDLPDPASLIPDIPAPLRDFIITCGRCSPDERFQSVREAREVLPSVSPREERNRAVTSLVLVHAEHQRQEIKKLLEEFGNRAEEMGVELMMSEFRNV